jgi:hypothetical protein
MLKKYFLSSFLMFAMVFANDQNFHVISITKSGTHLLKKLITLLGKSWEENTIYHFVDGYKVPQDPENPTKYIFLIRDPRDLTLSYLGHINKYPEWFNGHPYHPVRSSGWPDRYDVFGLDLNTWNSLNEEQKLSVIIKNRRYDTGNFSYDGRSLISQWKNYLNLKDKYPHLLVKFEEIIGEQGKGCKEKQKETIIKIANYLGIDVTEEKVEFIQKNLFGDTWTFNKGITGRWKEVFTNAQKEEFKTAYADILNDLPYDFSNM